MTGRRLKGRNGIVIDSDGLQRKTVNTKLSSTKRLRSDIADLRQGLRLGEFHMKWVADPHMLANCLTKGDIHIAPSERKALKKMLLLALANNCTYIKGVPSQTVQREDVRNYVQLLE